MTVVRSRIGIPTLPDFEGGRGTHGRGTPLVVDTGTAAGYILTDENEIVVLNGGQLIDQDALDLFASTGGMLVLRAGIHDIDVPLVLLNAIGVVIQGAGKGRTILRPTPALSGLTVLSLHDCRDCSIRDLWIDGNVSGPPDAAIESRNITGLTVNPTANEFRNLILGSDSSDAMVKGIKFTGDVDTNNDNHELHQVVCRNLIGAGLSIEHSQSQLHKLYNFVADNCDTAIDCAAGGCFNLFGGSITCRSVDFKFGTGTYYGHTTTINNVSIEDSALLLSAASSANIYVSISHLDHSADVAASADYIDFASVDGLLKITDSNMICANPVNGSFSDDGQMIVMENNVDSFGQISWAGNLHLARNQHLAGTLTMAPASNATGCVVDDMGGGFTANSIRTYGDRLTLESDASQPLVLASGSGANLLFQPAGSIAWQMNTSGSLITQTDGGVNIGESGANRPATVFTQNVTANVVEIPIEQGSDPSVGTNGAKLYLKDNGSGKTQLFVIFNTGAAQLLATQP